MESNLEPINIFDFDGTLTTETWPKFWVWVKKFGYSGEKRNDDLENAIAKYRETHSGDILETFFGFFNDLLVKNNETITYEDLLEGERYIKYHPGVIDFLEKSLVKNYIVSGGFKEFLENLKIANNFEKIYGSDLKHNENGLISGVEKIMTDEKKILAIKDILKINNRLENDCREVYYIGDGFSDAVAMSFVHNNGGKSILVYQSDKKDKFNLQNREIYEKINEAEIVDYYCTADYRKGSKLFDFLQRNKEENKN